MAPANVLAETYFYPRGGRLRSTGGRSTSPGYFYPRPPRGGRPAGNGGPDSAQGNFYPRPPRGGRLIVLMARMTGAVISIHALREEGDSLKLRPVMLPQ